MKTSICIFAIVAGASLTAVAAPPNPPGTPALTNSSPIPKPMPPEKPTPPPNPPGTPAIPAPNPPGQPAIPAPNPPGQPSLPPMPNTPTPQPNTPAPNPSFPTPRPPGS